MNEKLNEAIEALKVCWKQQIADGVVMPPEVMKVLELDGEQQWPRDGDEYWHLDSYGDPEGCDWEVDYLEKKRVLIGNCFRTKAEAEKHRDWLKSVAEIRRMIGDKTGLCRPAIIDGKPSYTYINCNSFGCKTPEQAIQVASSPAFKTFLGAE